MCINRIDCRDTFLLRLEQLRTLGLPLPTDRIVNTASTSASWRLLQICKNRVLFCKTGGSLAPRNSRSESDSVRSRAISAGLINLVYLRCQRCSKKSSEYLLNSFADSARLLINGAVGYRTTHMSRWKLSMKSTTHKSPWAGNRFKTLAPTAESPKKLHIELGEFLWITQKWFVNAVVSSSSAKCLTSVLEMNSFWW